MGLTFEFGAGPIPRAVIVPSGKLPFFDSLTIVQGNPKFCALWNNAVIPNSVLYGIMLLALQ